MGSLRSGLRNVQEQQDERWLSNTNQQSRQRNQHQQNPNILTLSHWWTEWSWGRANQSKLTSWIFLTGVILFHMVHSLYYVNSSNYFLPKSTSWNACQNQWVQCGIHPERMFHQEDLSADLKGITSGFLRIGWDRHLGRKQKEPRVSKKKEKQ